MTLQQYMEAHGLSIHGLSLHLGLSNSTVYGWVARGRPVTPEAIPLIVRKTRGEVTAAELRPDLARMFGVAPPSAPARSLRAKGMPVARPA